MTKPQRAQPSWRKRFIEDVRTFQAATGMKFTVIGQNAIQNPRVWGRIMKGGSLTVDKADEFYDYMNKVGAQLNITFDRFNPIVKE